MINQQILRERTKKFAIDTIRFTRNLSESYERRVIARQLVRSGTSVGANYRAACRSRSQAEYFAKLCIVLEEADETLFWLEILNEAELTNKAMVEKMILEATELVKIFSTTRKAVGKNLKR